MYMYMYYTLSVLSYYMHVRIALLDLPSLSLLFSFCTWKALYVKLTS